MKLRDVVDTLKAVVVVALGVGALLAFVLGILKVFGEEGIVVLLLGVIACLVISFLWITVLDVREHFRRRRAE